MPTSKNKYIVFGSTTITVPSKMGGYRYHKPYLFTTITPITRRLSYRGNKLAIKLQINPNSSYKIQRVPKTTRNFSYIT